MSTISKPQNENSQTPMNPMVFYPRFSHISEKVFENLDIKSLENCRVISKSWQGCIDNQNILWNEIAKNQNANKALQIACKKGHLKIVKVLIKKCAEFEIDFNARDIKEMTAFQVACNKGHLDIGF